MSTTYLTSESIHVVSLVEDLSDTNSVIAFGIVEVVVQEIHVHPCFPVLGNGGALIGEGEGEVDEMERICEDNG